MLSRFSVFIFLTPIQEGSYQDPVETLKEKKSNNCYFVKSELNFITNVIFVPV